MADAKMKQLRIKTGVVKRLLKEKTMYEAEVRTLEAKMEKLRSDGTDAYTVRKQEEVLGESRAMVPDTLRRLAAALPDLNSIISESEEELAETEELKAARGIALEAGAIVAQ